MRGRPSNGHRVRRAQGRARAAGRCGAPSSSSRRPRAPFSAACASAVVVVVRQRRRPERVATRVETGGHAGPTLSGPAPGGSGSGRPCGQRRRGIRSPFGDGRAERARARPRPRPQGCDPEGPSRRAPRQPTSRRRARGRFRVRRLDWAASRSGRRRRLRPRLADAWAVVRHGHLHHGLTRPAGEPDHAVVGRSLDGVLDQRVEGGLEPFTVGQRGSAPAPSRAPSAAPVSPRATRSPTSSTSSTSTTPARPTSGPRTRVRLLDDRSAGYPGSLPWPSIARGPAGEPDLHPGRPGRLRRAAWTCPTAAT